MVRSVALARSRSPRRRGASPLAAWLAASALLFGQSATIVHADQTISTAVTGPVFGNNAAITVTPTGSVTNNAGGSGILTSPTNTVTTLSSAGAISAFDYGINNDLNTIGSISNSGSVTGGFAAVLNSGAVGTFTNTLAGTTTSAGGVGLKNVGTFTTLSNAGLITGYSHSVLNEAGAMIVTLTNSGTVNAGTGVTNSGTIGTLTNQAAGTITGGDNGVNVAAGGGIGSLSNAGSVSGYNGVVATGSITSLDNTGTIFGERGVYVNGSGYLGTLNNGGQLSGGGSGALRTEQGTTLDTLTNSGTIGGVNAVVLGGSAGTITNTATGSIEGTARALYFYAGSIDQITNDGLVSGGAGYSALETIAGSAFTALTNTGTMSGQNTFVLGGTAGTITNDHTGVFQGIDRGIYLYDGSIDQISNAGAIQAALAGINTLAGTTVTSLDNSGTISTTNYGLFISGSVGTVSNLALGQITTTTNDAVYVEAGGTVTSLSNDNVISGGDRGVRNLGTLTTLTNSGTVSGGQVGVDNFGGSIGTLTNLAGGEISSNVYYGVLAYGGSIGTIDNAGLISGASRGIENYLATIGTVTNQAGATIDGGARGVQNGGTLTTLTNAGALQGTNYGIVYDGNGSLLDNQASGSILSVVDDAVYVGGGISLTTLSNAGTISGGDRGVRSWGTLTTLTNAGTIIGGKMGLDVAGGTLGSVDNSGTIEGSIYYGVYASGGALTSLTNSGDILGAWVAVHNDYQAIGTITNDLGGTIQGSLYDAIHNVGGTITTIDNSGVVNGLGRTGIRNEDYGGNAHTVSIINRLGASVSGADFGIANLQTWGNTATIDSIDNAGSVFGVFYGVYNAFGTITSLVNSDAINGGSASVYNDGGIIGSLDNSGSVGDVQNVYGVIQSVTNTGQFGTLTNSGVIGTGSGTAISSTGAGAVIGEIYNQGTISGGVTIENQDVVVHGNTSPYFGLIHNGTINIKNGSLTFADGSTYLDSDVIVSSLAGTAGAGTMTNQGELILGTSHNVDGSFTQSAAGVLTLVLYGTLPGEYGALVGTGSASIDGILNLEQGFPIADGQSFSLLSFASAVGAFAGLSVDGTPLSSLGGGQWAYAGLILTEILSGGNYSISVTSSAVPEIDPAGLGSVVSLLLGALALAERRRGRKRGC